MKFEACGAIGTIDDVADLNSLSEAASPPISDRSASLRASPIAKPASSGAYWIPESDAGELRVLGFSDCGDVEVGSAFGVPPTAGGVLRVGIHENRRRRPIVIGPHASAEGTSDAQPWHVQAERSGSPRRSRFTGAAVIARNCNVVRGVLVAPGGWCRRPVGWRWSAVRLRRFSRSCQRALRPSRDGTVISVDDVTVEVIHVGGPGFTYDPESGDVP